MGYSAGSVIGGQLEVVLDNHPLYRKEEVFLLAGLSPSGQILAIATLLIDKASCMARDCELAD